MNRQKLSILIGIMLCVLLSACGDGERNNQPNADLKNLFYLTKDMFSMKMILRLNHV